MADTKISNAMSVEQWDKKHHVAYVRSNRFKLYMGKDENAIIQVKHDLTKKEGDAITINLIGALPTGSGPNDGSTDLVGNEKALPNDGHRVSVEIVRDATLVKVDEEKKSPIDIRNAGKVALKELQMRYLRDSIIEGMASVGGKAFADATAAEKNAWMDANSDRVLFGSEVGNYTAGDFAASLANIDGTNDRATADLVELAKSQAQGATVANSDGIRPFKYGEDEETFVMFVGSNTFRDIKRDLRTYHKDAMPDGKNNPLFKGSESLLWDGVVIRHIPEIKALAGVGAAGIDVEPYFFCGAQALAAVWGQLTKTTARKEDDYGLKHGVGFMEMRGVEKVLYGQGTAGVQWGMLSGFAASIPNA